MNRPLILLIFANDRAAYLDSIRKERQRLIILLQPAADALGLELKDIDYSTVDGVIDLLNVQHERLAVLHFAGHSGAELLQLDEGAAHANGLAAKLGECPNLKLVFLNGCNNAALVQAIADAGIPNVIGTRQPIADEAAKQFSQGFFKALAEQGRSVAEAFTQAETDVQLTGQYPRSLDISQPPTGQQDLPWFMASRAPDWKLADAANPCNRLPTLPPRELPAEPFKDLYYYRQQDADIFFGRCRDTLSILHLLEQEEPLILLHGGAGVGKSSFLQAGLIPRLAARGQTVHTFRYSDFDPQHSLNAQIFPTDDIASVRKRLLDAAPSLPDIWIIDQLEEIFLYDGDAPAQTIPTRLYALLDSLHTLLYPAQGHAKAILCLRKDWFSELNEACKQYGLGCYEHFLLPLDKAAIIEAIESPARLPRLHDKYQLTIHDPADGRLAGQIADDLLRDAGSSIAPTLQIILYQLWQQVKNRRPDQRIWDQALYLQQEVRGLEDHLQRQLADIASLQNHEFGAWGKAAHASGLLLDVLYAHTSKPHHTAAPLTREQYNQLYPHIPYRQALLKALTDRHLLIDPQQDSDDGQHGNRQTRMAHDTLAHLVGTLYSQSELPGQKARRILHNRLPDFLSAQQATDAEPPLLDSFDLRTVQAGLYGTYALTTDETRLLELSVAEQHRQQDRAKRRKLAGFTALLIIVGLVGFSVYKQIEVGMTRQTALFNSLLQQAITLRNNGENLTKAKHLLAQAIQQSQTEQQADSALIAYNNIASGKLMALREDAGQNMPDIPNDSGSITSADKKYTLSWGRGVNDPVLHLQDNSCKPEPCKEKDIEHDDAVMGAVFSAGGNQFLSWGWGNTLRLWDTASGLPLRQFAHGAEVVSARFSADGKQIISLANDATLYQWQNQADSVIVPFKPATPLQQAALSPDGRYRLKQAVKTLYLQDIASNQTIRQFEHRYQLNNSMPATFSPNGHFILSTTVDDDTAHLWDIESGQEVGRFEDTLYRKSNGVMSASFAEDGKRILGHGGLGSSQEWRLYPMYYPQFPSSCYPLEVQAQTATRLTDTGKVEGIKPQEWRELKARYDGIIQQITAGGKLSADHCNSDG